MGAFDDLIPKNSSSGAFDDLVKNNQKPQEEGFGSKLKDYGNAVSSALGLGIVNLQSSVANFLQAPAANTLSAIKSTGALLDRGYVDASNAIGKGDPNFNVKKYDQDIQEEAQRASGFAAETRADNVKNSVLAKGLKFLEDDGRKRNAEIKADDEKVNPNLLEQQKNISAANGFVDTLKASVQNPLALTHTLVESLPGLAVGLGSGRIAASRTLAAGASAGDAAAARVAAAGGDAAAQEVAAKTAIDALQEQATRAASTAGIASEAATSGLSSRESSYTQVKQTPFEKLSESPRFNELVKQTGDREKSREILANEVADSTPILSAGLTGLGTVVTNKLYGGDATAKVLSGVEKPGLKAVLKDISQESAEEVIQGVPQGYSDHRAMQLADPNKKFNLKSEIAQNALGGIVLGGAGHGAAYAKQKFNDVRVGVADAIKNRYENNIVKTISTNTQIEPSDEVQLTEPEKALANPKVITPLDRVNEIDVNLKKLSPENGYGEVFDQERSDLLNERASILQSFPRLQEGAPTSFTTEDGAKLNGRYALIDANDLQTSHDIDLRENPNYPPELQPRERERAASAAQISGIVQKIDPARLGASADAGTGAPIIGADGLVESGNARSIALKRIYRVPGQKAEDYKAYLTANAAQFGIDPVQIEQLQNPVLVRVRDTPVDRAEFARQANAPTVARLSTVEQAHADAKRLDVLDDLSPTDSGDFSNSTNFISRFVAKVPQTERSELVDTDGKLSAAGYARVRNAVLAKAYGDSPVILRLTESLNDNLRNVSKALLQVAPKVAKVRASIKDGNLHDADITPDLLSAVEELSRIKDSGQSVSEYLNQNDIFDDNTSSESKELLQFLDENIRRPKQIAEFILRYYEALESIGNPKQADIFNDNSAPEKSDLLNLAKRDNNDQPIIEQGRNQESPVPAGQNVIERADQSSNQEGNRGDQTPAGGEGQGVIIADDRNDASLDRLDKNDPGKSHNGVEYNNQVVSSNPNSQPARKDLGTSISTPPFDGIAEGSSEVSTEEAVFKANSTAVLGFTVDALTSQVKAITDQWKNAPKINIVESPSDLPFAAPSNARGAYYNGEIYLVASNIHSQQDAEIVLFHEALGHAGLRGAFRDSLIPLLRKLAIDNPSIAKAAANWRNENKGLRGKRSEDEWLTTSVEEVLANIAESGKPIKGFDQFLSKVQSALRSVGLNAVADWIGRHSNAEVARLLTAARKHIIDGNKSHVLAGEEAKAFSFDPNADKSAEAALEEISKIGDAFAYPKSESNTVEGITADIDSNIKVRKFNNIPGETRYQFDLPDGNTARLIVRPFNKYGKSIYGFDLDENNEITNQIDVRPGKFPEEANGKGDVWIDVSLLKEGKGYGSKIYQIAANYAYNTGQVFIGDPAGISHEALLRRPEQMLSSALKFGTTEHIAPHPIQIKGDKKNGIAPLDWVYGDHIGNIQKLIDATLQNIDNVGGIGGIEYDKRSGEFIDGTNTAIGRRDLFNLAEVGLARAAKAGGGTLARYAFLKSILPTDGHGKQAGRQPGAVLVQLSNQLRNHVSTVEQNVGADPESKRIFYSTARDNLTPSQRADAIIKQSAATPAPIDAAVKAVVKISQLDKLTKAVYDGAGFILDRYTPETIKAGVVSDYGIPEAVIDRRTVLSAHINVQTRKIGKFVDQLSSLTRQESRVAYEWLNNKDPQALKYFENQLPPESVAVLADIKKTIDDLSKEAVSLGQLSQEAYDKNAFEYLRRSYVKHTFEQYKGNEKKRSRAISILGDQYKGRGLSEIASMQQIENAAPAWWNRKLQEGKADKQLKGEKFIRLEKHAASGEGTIPLEGIGDRPKGKLQSVVYYPANETIPTKYAEWSQAGTFEVRDVKGGNVILWRDFTKQEREKMGEIDEARYAIANTLHTMVNDIETARYLEWINKKYGFAHPEQVPGKVIEAKELSFTTLGTVYKPGDFVQVPDTKVQGTDVKKYGALAGKYIPGPIWNDIRQIGQGSFKPFGEVYSKILRAWKTSKTALSPAVHTNNVAANFVMADWHDVSAGHIYKALRIILGTHDKDGTGVIGRAGNAAARLGIVDREAAKEILARYQDSGGNIGTYASKELQNEQIQPLLDAIEKELEQNGESPNAQVGVMNAIQFLRHGEVSAAYQAAIGSKPSKAIANEAKNLIDLYQSEDDVFRLAAWLKAKEDGATDIEAGKKSRKSFLDYNINAPWVSALRSTAFPFVAFSYRAIPMLAEIAAKRPWKLLKLAAIAGGLNALGYALSGGDEDDERRYLPEEKSGRVWGMVPKLVRMGWNDEHDQPVFLDIRRFIPVGDIADVDQGHSVLPIPPSMMPGGPLELLAEGFLNKSSFTGKNITLETDTNFEKLLKTGDYLYKAVAPNIALLPGTYSFENITNAGKGKTDTFGRELSVNQALLNSVGIKIGSYGTDTLRVNAGKKLNAELSEIDTNINALSKEYSRKGLTYDEFIEKATKQQDKKKKIIEEFRAK